ncbi:MAG: hypothetical protein UGE23_10250 [Peptococcaceae bacterium]|nr:hypothetical protein [Peptococcaceae bacterium]
MDKIYFCRVVADARWRACARKKPTALIFSPLRMRLAIDKALPPFYT